MGRNNHHCGMHLIWHKYYGLFDNPPYYTGNDSQVITLNEKPSEEEVKKTKHDFCDDVSQNCETSENLTVSSNSTASPCIDTPIGTEHFLVPPYVMANIMVLALKNKKDIYEILLECEDLIKKDHRTNPPKSKDFTSSHDYWACMPKLESSIIFLSLLSEKLDCEVYELFIENESRRKKFVYRLIEELKSDEYIIWEHEESDENGSVSFYIDYFDIFYRIARPHCDKSFESRMPLKFEKIILNSGGVTYTVSFGTTLLCFETKDDYCFKGACLLEESTGKLADFIEDILASYPEWTV